MRRHIIIFGALAASGAAAAAETVPLPPERPDIAMPSPCRAALETVARISPLPARRGPGACGGADLVTLEAVRLPDGALVAVSPPAELRCEMAAQIALWIRDDAAPAFAPQRLVGIGNYDSYDCRVRNRVPGAKISEHGKGNALDIRAFRLDDGKVVSPVDPGVVHALRATLKQSACSLFTTVLGPGSDGYHEQHVHLDMAARRSGYRICQWDLRDAAVQVATVPLPRARPGDETKTGKAE